MLYENFPKKQTSNAFENVPVLQLIPFVLCSVWYCLHPCNFNDETFEKCEVHKIRSTVLFGMSVDLIEFNSIVLPDFIIVKIVVD